MAGRGRLAGILTDEDVEQLTAFIDQLYDLEAQELVPPLDRPA